MSRKLPYFQFEPAQYLSGDIQFCSLQAQGLFINLCSLYWQRECCLSREQINRKFSEHLEVLKELEDESMIIFDDSGLLIIDFLVVQYSDILNRKKALSEAGKKGAERRKELATLKLPLSEASATLKQLDNIREDNKKEDNTKEKKFNFKFSLLDFGFDKDLVEDWLKVRKSKKSSNTETAFNGFIKQVNLCGKDKNDILRQCVENSWAGFKSEWIKESKTRIEGGKMNKNVWA